MKEGIWFIQKYTDNAMFQYRVEKIYFSGKTPYQKIDIVQITLFGKSLFLDDKIQSAEVDEFVYHEALVHPAMMAHPNPKKILIIGGGEGATLREVLKHNTVKKATMVDIDEELVKLCAKHMPEWSNGAFESSKTELIFDDARKFIEHANEKYDVIISDLTEPLEKGPSIYLFTREFYERIFNILDENGVLVVQSGSADPYYNRFFASVYKTLKDVFPLVKPYWTFIFSFNLPWGFNLALKKEQCLEINKRKFKNRIDQSKFGRLKFYHMDLDKGLFSLPLYLHEALSQGRVSTDSQPFIWEA
ncbi:polyamine aminopropyltransferase [Candidatus Aminicenantes bacterium AH-873-B07]|jgi:spermidine synthase|nr:polyamine aminopropyltransferase [Candidatus Aminicenantes bacterium AH-873-B07]